MTEDQINEVAQIICNTWDFCGNVRSAIYQWTSEKGHTMTEQEYTKCFDVAQEQWDASLEA